MLARSLPRPRMSALACYRLVCRAVLCTAFVPTVLVASLALGGCRSSTPAPAMPAALPAVSAGSQAPGQAAGTSALPDARSDPLAALRYSESPNVLRSATITYTFAITIAGMLQGQAGAKAVEAPLIIMKGSGPGAMRLEDAAAGKIDLRLALDLNMSDPQGERQEHLQIVRVGNDTWTRSGAAAWERADIPLGARDVTDPTTVLGLLWSAQAANWIANGQLNGESVQRLQVTVDPARVSLWAALQKQVSGSNRLSMAPPTTRADVFLSANDLLPRKATLTAGALMSAEQQSSGRPAQMRWTMDQTLMLGSVNQSVEIKAPAGS